MDPSVLETFSRFFVRHQDLFFGVGLRLAGAGVLFFAARIYLRRFHTRWLHQLEPRLGRHTTVLLTRFSAYGIWLFWLFGVLILFGVNPGTLIAGLGLFSVAIGFAAQKSVSNLISGLFILFDRPFEIGDFVDIGGTVGTVMTIDLLSTRIRTPDNLLVRIPNEAVLGSVIKNFTHFDIRRLSLQVGVGYDSDLKQVQDVLHRVLSEHPLVLVDPAPRVMLTEFADSSINFEIWVWVERTHFLDARTQIAQAIKEAFDREGIEIPFPQRVVYLHGTRDALDG